MIRFCSNNLLRENNELYDQINECVVMDETIWEKGRKCFAKHRTAPGKIAVLPIVDKAHRLICFAWQDEESNRELRMIQELRKGGDDWITFYDLHTDYEGVTIHGCNELAWNLVAYLKDKNIAVNLDGAFWQEITMQKSYEMSVDQSYEIWAEGVQQKKEKLSDERLRSVSAEFECIDGIYEANIAAGKIVDSEGDFAWLLEKLRKEKEIVIRGIGTMAQDAYDLLLANDIDICAFQSEDKRNEGRFLFRKPILKMKEILELYNNAVIIECSQKHSAWGFGDVDAYDYEGYERNQHYFLLRDYIEIPENNLTHILYGKNLVLLGDVSLCNRMCRWWKRQKNEDGTIRYFDILNENKAEVDKLQIEVIDDKKTNEDDIYVLVVPKYDSEFRITKETAVKYNVYISQMRECGIIDYTDYFSDMKKCMHLEIEKEKYTKKILQPYGILLGAIPARSGNWLIKQSLAGHSQVITIEDYGFFNNNLYSICIRLAEKKADDILGDFWTLFQKESGMEAVSRDFPNKEKFDYKLKELLALDVQFTSQELFVMLHIAYEAMYEREILSLEDIIIYWEPHHWNRDLVREWAFWLESEEIKGFTISTVRNRYINAGSYVRLDIENGEIWSRIHHHMHSYWCIKSQNIYGNWEERIIKFEELKCKPRETLIAFCEWIGISFQDTLLETTYHGEKAYSAGITGFDTKPAYNLYEEYFSAFDRMRISMLAAAFQRTYGYPYVSCLDFSRRELQEMFLKKFRWEKLLGMTEGKNEISIYELQKHVRKLLWQAHYVEIKQEKEKDK